MPILIVLLELFVGTLAVWVLVFEVALYEQFPIKSLETLFIFSWILLLVLMARPWIRRIRVTGRRERHFARDTIIFGGLVGLLVLLASRPDADDVHYMYQPMVDVSTPSGPFTAYPFYVPFRGERVVVPLLSENEAYEAMVVVLAHMAGIEPLQAYHNVFAFLAATVWVVTFALLFRRFRIPRNRAWLALLVTVIFLLLDGNLHRSVGNFTLLRIWQGKVIAWAILRPAFLLFALRFLGRPNIHRFGMLFVTGVVSFFVNRSSIFLFVVLGTAIAVSYLLAFLRNRRHRVRTLVPIAVIIPLWILGAYIASSTLPPGTRLFSEMASVSRTTTPSTNSIDLRVTSWWTSLEVLVIGTTLILGRDALFLLILPLFAVPRPLNKFLPLLSLTVAVLALSPLTGPTWYYFIKTVYWRFYYALPLPLCVGLAAHLLPSPSKSGRRVFTRIGLAIVLIVVTVVAVDRPALSAANSVQLKYPFEYRFRSAPLTFARSVAPRLSGKLVAAPDEIANILALTEYRSIGLVYSRVSPGSASLMADRVLSGCQVNALTARGLGRALRRGVDAIIMSACNEATVRELSILLPGYRFEEEKEVADSNFRLYWVRKVGAKGR